jgi:hypothetical protein
MRPVQHVDSLETAYSHMNELRRMWPGDYLILEHDAVGRSGRTRTIDGDRGGPSGS